MVSTTVLDVQDLTISPEEPVEESTLLSQELVHRHHRTEDIELDDDDEEDGHLTLQPPWWKVPPWWLLGMAVSVTIAPHIEIYTMLACKAHRPEILKYDQSGAVSPYDGLFLDSSTSITHLTGSSEMPTLFDCAVSGGCVRRTFVDVNVEYSAADPSPSRRKMCAQDPIVQAAVAKLEAVKSACIGILTCLTTGWWGSLSDRRGRKLIMGISITGTLLSDLIFIVVASYSDYVPGGYWFLIVGSLIDGAAGGLTTSIAAIHAYLADTTPETERSHAFSAGLGLVSCGMALGPSLGGLLIRITGQSLSVFYLSTWLHLLYALIVWFIIPESLSKKRMLRARAKYKDCEVEGPRLSLAARLLIRLKGLFGFLSPLSVLIPAVDNITGNPLRRGRRNWNLMVVAVGYGLTLVAMMGSYIYKFQYASRTFGWTSETLSYWLSLIDAVRAVFLAVLLPNLIKVFKPSDPSVIESVETSNTDHPSCSRDVSVTESGPDPITQHSPAIQKGIDSPLFDLTLVRASLLIDIIANTCMGLSFSPMTFTVFSMLGATSAGFNPAFQSMALTLYSRREGDSEAGRLLGAMSVVQALCSQIIGPPLFGMVYMKTVAVYPRTIFFVSVVTVVIVLLILGLVRLPNNAHRSLRT